MQPYQLNIQEMHTDHKLSVIGRQTDGMNVWGYLGGGGLGGGGGGLGGGGEGGGGLQTEYSSSSGSPYLFEQARSSANAGKLRSENDGFTVKLRCL